MKAIYELLQVCCVTLVLHSGSQFEPCAAQHFWEASVCRQRDMKMPQSQPCGQSLPGWHITNVGSADGLQNISNLQAGYTDVVHMKGGLSQWRYEGLPLENK